MGQPIGFRVDLEVMAMNAYSKYLKFAGLDTHILMQFSVINRTPVAEMYRYILQPQLLLDKGSIFFSLMELANLLNFFHDITLLNKNRSYKKQYLNFIIHF